MMSSFPLYLDQEDITRRLLTLQDTTGYDMIQKHGQRIYGPPPGWNGPLPDKGTEVYCYRIPRDCFEDELVPIFSLVGKIYELRLMIEFSGTNRSYCYVRYTEQKEAREAIRRLNNYQIREGYPLAVTRSVDNRKLNIKTMPQLDKEEHEVVQELSIVVEGVSRVEFKSRGWIEVEFLTHRQAALARRQLVPGNLVIFDIVQIKVVDWADPDDDNSIDESSGQLISVGNLPSSVSQPRVEEVFNHLSGGQVDKVMMFRNMVMISFTTNEGAKNAMEKSNNLLLDGSKLEVRWWSSKKRLDKGQVSYSSLPRSRSGGDRGLGLDRLCSATSNMGLYSPYVQQRFYSTNVGTTMDMQLYSPNHQGSHSSNIRTTRDIGLYSWPWSRHTVNGSLVSQFQVPPPPIPSQASSYSNVSPSTRYSSGPGNHFSLFPPTTASSPLSRPPSLLLSRPDSPKPVLAVPPLHRSSFSLSVHPGSDGDLPGYAAYL